MGFLESARTLTIIETDDPSDRYFEVYGLVSADEGDFLSYCVYKGWLLRYEWVDISGRKYPIWGYQTGFKEFQEY
jgi:hypothetical protein